MTPDETLDEAVADLKAHCGVQRALEAVEALEDLCSVSPEPDFAARLLRTLAKLAREELRGVHDFAVTVHRGQITQAERVKRERIA